MGATLTPTLAFLILLTTQPSPAPDRPVVVYLRVDQGGGLTETQLAQAVSLQRVWLSYFPVKN